MGIIVLLVVVAVVGAVVIVLAGRTGGAGEFAPDRPNFELPEQPLHGPDIDSVRFAVGMRGYRMDQVDLVMDRLASELTARDREIAALRGEPWPDEAATPVAATAPVEGGEPVASPESVDFGGATAEDLADRG